MGFLRFTDNTTEYELPQDLALEPEMLLDEKERLYRISLSDIGIIDSKTKELYCNLFEGINLKLTKSFIDGFEIISDTVFLKTAIGYVTIRKEPYGTVYDIEMPIESTKITIKEDKIARARNTGIVKDKKIDRNRKITRKGISK